MKKLVVLLILAIALSVCSPVYSARPAEAIMGGDPETGAWLARQTWGIMLGCWKAYWAPEGKKLEAFKEGYKEGSESEVAGLAGGTISY